MRTLMCIVVLVLASSGYCNPRYLEITAGADGTVTSWRSSRSSVSSTPGATVIPWVDMSRDDLTTRRKPAAGVSVYRLQNGALQRRSTADIESDEKANRRKDLKVALAEKKAKLKALDGSEDEDLATEAASVRAEIKKLDKELEGCR